MGDETFGELSCVSSGRRGVVWGFVEMLLEQGQRDYKKGTLMAYVYYLQRRIHLDLPFLWLEPLGPLEAIDNIMAHISAPRGREIGECLRSDRDMRLVKSHTHQQKRATKSEPRD